MEPAAHFPTDVISVGRALGKPINVLTTERMGHCPGARTSREDPDVHVRCQGHSGKENQSLAEATAVKADFIQELLQQGKRNFSMKLGSIPSTAGMRGIYSRGASGGQEMENY